MLSRSGGSNIPPPSGLSRPLPRTGERSVSGSAFAFLFAEMITYYQARIQSASELETRLSAAGESVGQRLWDVVSLRDRPAKRELTVVNVLQFISGSVWQQLFGKPADALEKSTDPSHGPLAFMIREEDPLTNHYISMPKELARLNVASYVAGILTGMLNTAGFLVSEVQAVTVPATGTNPRDGVVFLIKFDASVAARESS